MFNPLLEGMSELSDDQLLGKINELNTKMRQASQAGMSVSYTHLRAHET